VLKKKKKKDFISFKVLSCSSKPYEMIMTHI